MNENKYIFKKLLFLVVLICTLISSKEVSSQCNIDYFIAGNPNDTCFVAGSDITSSYNANVGWNITDTNGASVSNYFTPPGLVTSTWPNVPSGNFTIQTYSFTGPVWAPWVALCSKTITIATGPLYLSDTTLTYCQWNTVNLEEILSSSLINAIAPEYEFSISGVVINGNNYEINTAFSIIDVTVTDVSGCITTALASITQNTNTEVKEIIKITDILGRESKGT